VQSTVTEQNWRIASRATWVPLVAWIGLVVVANRWGESLIEGGRAIKVGVPPLHAKWDIDTVIGRPELVVLTVGVALLVLVPRVAAYASWRTLLWTTPAAAGVWALALNATRGTAALVQGISNRHEYLGDVDAVGSPLHFLRAFTDNVHQYATHTQGHPPGFVLILWSLRGVSLGGANWAAVLCIASGAATSAVVLLTVRDVAGEPVARAAAPFVTLAPVALWVATSADAFFALVAACAVAGMVRAVVKAQDASSRAAVFGGLCFGLGLLCSYGLALVAAIPAAVAIRQRRLPALIPAFLATAVVLAVAYGAGFNYLDGLRVSRDAYFDGVASVRPMSYAIVANLAAFAIALGPAMAVAIARVRGRLGLLVGGALLAALLADLSGMSKLEVERIWLPFAFWVLPAGATLTIRPGARMGRSWLALQMGCAVAIQMVVRTGW
jgi:methylthioxylose transferase